jgi:hypothetical protein
MINAAAAIPAYHLRKPVRCVCSCDATVAGVAPLQSYNGIATLLSHLTLWHFSSSVSLLGCTHLQAGA